MNRTSCKDLIAGILDKNRNLFLLHGLDIDRYFWVESQLNMYLVIDNIISIFFNLESIFIGVNNDPKTRTLIDSTFLCYTNTGKHIILKFGSEYYTFEDLEYMLSYIIKKLLIRSGS